MNKIFEKIDDYFYKNHKKLWSLNNRVYRFRRDCWAEIRGFFNPHNQLKIRNTPRTWNDRSERVLHAVFTILCDFVEKEQGGIVELKKYIAECEDSTKSYYDENYVKFGGYHLAMKAIVSLYEWYTGVNWSDPTGHDAIENPTAEDYIAWGKAEDAFEILCTEKLKEAIATRGAWWT